MSINLRPLSSENALWVEESQYEAWVRSAGDGWSECTEESEWLAKLHYLRAGFKAGKLNSEQFSRREMRLIQAWLHRRF